MLNAFWYEYFLSKNAIQMFSMILTIAQCICYILQHNKICTTETHFFLGSYNFNMLDTSFSE